MSQSEEIKLRKAIMAYACEANDLLINARLFGLDYDRLELLVSNLDLLANMSVEAAWDMASIEACYMRHGFEYTPFSSGRLFQRVNQSETT